MDENLNTNEQAENLEQANQNQAENLSNPEETQGQSQEQPQEYAVIAVDQENQEVGVISGLDENGKLKTVPSDSDPKEFMKVDQHLNPIENFIKNFWFQFNDDRKFKYYRAPADNVQESAQLIKNAVQHPEQQADPKVKEMAVSKPFYNENNIDKEAMHYLGWSDTTFPPAEWNRMLRNEMTRNLYFYKTKLYGATIQGWARVGLKTDGQNVNFDLHSYNPKPYLKKIFEHETSVQDQINLLTTGNMGRIVPCKYGPNGEEFLGIISLDHLTNEPKCMRAESIRIPDVYRGSVITPESKIILATGDAVFQKDMQRPDGKGTYDNWIQVSADFRGLTDVPNKQMQKMELGKILEDPKLYVPLKVGGQPLKPIQRAIVANGGTILLRNVKDKTGVHNYYYKQVPGEGFKIFNEKDPKYIGMAIEVKESLKAYTEKLKVKSLTTEEEQKQAPQNTIDVNPPKNSEKQIFQETSEEKPNPIETQKQIPSQITNTPDQESEGKQSEKPAQEETNKKHEEIALKSKHNKNKGQHI